MRKECFPFDFLLCVVTSMQSYLGITASAEFSVFRLSVGDSDQMEFVLQSSPHATS